MHMLAARRTERIRTAEPSDRDGSRRSSSGDNCGVSRRSPKCRSWPERDSRRRSRCRAYENDRRPRLGRPAKWLKDRRSAGQEPGGCATSGTFRNVVFVRPYSVHRLAEYQGGIPSRSPKQSLRSAKPLGLTALWRTPRMGVDSAQAGLKSPSRRDSRRRRKSCRLF